MQYRVEISLTREQLILLRKEYAELRVMGGAPMLIPISAVGLILDEIACKYDLPNEQIPEPTLEELGLQIAEILRSHCTNKARLAAIKKLLIDRELYGDLPQEKPPNYPNC
jgi:hypothetical protein